MMLEEFLHAGIEPGDPVVVLIAASMVRDDMPWLYELALEVYRTAKTGNHEALERELRRFRLCAKAMMRNPIADDFGYFSDESRIFAIEFPQMLEHMLRRSQSATTATYGDVKKK